MSNSAGYELVIIWASGEHSVYIYPTEISAQCGVDGMLKANGEQISWWCIRRASWF